MYIAAFLQKAKKRKDQKQHQFQIYLKFFL